MKAAPLFFFLLLKILFFQQLLKNQSQIVFSKIFEKNNPYSFLRYISSRYLQPFSVTKVLWSIVRKRMLGCSICFPAFFKILRLENKPWRKTGPGAQAETKQQGSTRIMVAWKKAMAKEAWKKAMAKEAWKKAMTTEAWKKANQSEVELTGRLAWI
jgi:hypothetical protein